MGQEGHHHHEGGHMTLRLDDLWASGRLVELLAARYATLLLREGAGGRGRTPGERDADQWSLCGTRDALREVTQFAPGSHASFHRLCVSRRTWAAINGAMVALLKEDRWEWRSLSKALEALPHVRGDRSGTVGMVWSDGVDPGPAGRGGAGRERG